MTSEHSNRRLNTATRYRAVNLGFFVSLCALCAVVLGTLTQVAWARGAPAETTAEHVKAPALSVEAMHRCPVQD